MLALGCLAWCVYIVCAHTTSHAQPKARSLPACEDRPRENMRTPPKHVAGSYPHITAMEELKDDFREDRPILKIATVRTRSPCCVHRSTPPCHSIARHQPSAPNNAYSQYPGHTPPSPPNRDIASSATNVPPHHPPLHHLHHPLHLRRRRILVVLLQLHTRARHLRTRIPPIRPRPHHPASHNHLPRWQQQPPNRQARKMALRPRQHTRPGRPPKVRRRCRNGRPEEQDQLASRQLDGGTRVPGPHDDRTGCEASPWLGRGVER